MRIVIIITIAAALIAALSACASTTAARTPSQARASAAPNTTSPAASMPVTTPPAATSAAAPSSPAVAAPQVTARFNGSGTENTPPFTVPSSWHLSWAYWGCDGGTGNFIMEEDNTDGSTDYNGVSVNELGAGRGPVATYAYGDAGSHYFSVDSECSWSLAVVVGGS